MTILRRYRGVLRSLLRRFPIVTVLGPRQCGKTTFIRQALPAWAYFDLERPSDAAPLAADPEARLTQLRGPVVLDEAQRLPEIFPVLRGIVDRVGRRLTRLRRRAQAPPVMLAASNCATGSLAPRTISQDRFEDCVGKYEATVSWALDELVSCKTNAMDDPWYIRTINMSFCDLEWILRAESALAQFVSCTALPQLSGN